MIGKKERKNWEKLRIIEFTQLFYHRTWKTLYHRRESWNTHFVYFSYVLCCIKIGGILFTVLLTLRVVSLQFCATDLLTHVCFLNLLKNVETIAVTCHNLSLLVNCFQNKLLWCVLLMQPLNFSLLHVHKGNFHCNLTWSLWCSPYHQFVYSPHCSLHISCDTHNENLFKSWDPLSLAIVSFIPMTLLCDSAVIKRN